MKGDYQRYLAEIMTGTDRKEAAKNTLLTYKSAQDTFVSDLASFGTIRLGIAFNFSVFYREIMKSTDKAINLAKQEEPAVVKSVFNRSIVRCPGGEGEDEHDVVWFWLEKDKPHECAVCSQYFVLEVFGSGGDPYGHGSEG